MIQLIIGLGLSVAIVSSAAAQQQTYRIDNYDRYGNRLGYTIINPQTGRTDSYDKYSNHTGTGQITPPPAKAQPGQPLYIQPGQVIKK